MYAVIRDGSHQYRVREGDEIQVDRRDAAPGSTIDFEVVALGGDSPKVGTPLVDGAKVTAEILGEIRGPKTVFYRYRRRKDSHTRRGHRQPYTRVRIMKLEG